MISVQEPIVLLRSLNSTSAKCMLALMMSPQPLTNARLAHLTQSSRNSVASAMEVLADLGFAVRVSHRGGWGLTPGAAEMLLAARLEQGEPPSSDRDDDSTPLKDSDSQIYRAPSAIQEPGGGGNIKLINYPPPPESSCGHHSAPEELKRRTYRQKEPHRRAPPPDEAHLARVKAILKATPLLFGERVHGPPRRYPDLNLLLAWIADCYTRRDSLRKPARVAYSNLKNELIPDERFLHDPFSHLPTRFLEKAGLPVPADRLIDRGSSQGQPEGGLDSDAHQAPERSPPPHPSLEAPLESAGGRTALQSWEFALRALRDELPPGAYQRRVQPANLIGYQPEEAIFLVAAPDEDSRLWLQDHLGRILERRLQGCCGRQVRIDFITQAEIGD